MYAQTKRLINKNKPQMLKEKKKKEDRLEKPLGMEICFLAVVVLGEERSFLSVTHQTAVNVLFFCRNTQR